MADDERVAQMEARARHGNRIVTDDDVLFLVAEVENLRAERKRDRAGLDMASRRIDVLRDELAAAVRRAEHFEERFNQMCGRFDEIAARLVVAVRRAETAEALAEMVEYLLTCMEDPVANAYDGGTTRAVAHERLAEYREAVAKRTTQ